MLAWETTLPSQPFSKLLPLQMRLVREHDLAN